MSKIERPTKKQLARVIKLNKKILQLLPKKDSMYSMYKKMESRLEERYDTYEQFLINPYWTSDPKIKFNSDKSLGLGEYNIPPHDRN